MKIVEENQFTIVGSRNRPKTTLYILDVAAVAAVAAAGAVSAAVWPAPSSSCPPSPGCS